MSTANWKLWEEKGHPGAGKIFISITPLGKGRVSRGTQKILISRAEGDRRLQLLVDREKGTFALQSTSPNNFSDSFACYSETHLDLRDLFSSLGFALPPKTRRIHGKVGTDPRTGNKIVEFLLLDSFSRSPK